MAISRSDFLTVSDQPQIPPAFLPALELLCGRLATDDILWALTGSLSFALQGLPLTPRDIDLQTDRTGAYETERRLAAWVDRPVRFTRSGPLRSHFGRLSIEGVGIDIIGDIQTRRPDGTWRPPPDLAACRRYVQFGELSVPVLDLAYEAGAYARMGRLERASMLEAWLARPAGRGDLTGETG